MPAFHVQLARFLGGGSYGLYIWSNTIVEFSSAVTLFGMDIAVSEFDEQRKVVVVPAFDPEDEWFD